MEEQVVLVEVQVLEHQVVEDAPMAMLVVQEEHQQVNAVAAVAVAAAAAARMITTVAMEVPAVDGRAQILQLVPREMHLVDVTIPAIATPVLLAVQVLPVTMDL